MTVIFYNQYAFKCNTAVERESNERIQLKDRNLSCTQATKEAIKNYFQTQRYVPVIPLGIELADVFAWLVWMWQARKKFGWWLHSPGSDLKSSLHQYWEVTEAKNVWPCIKGVTQPIRQTQWSKQCRKNMIGNYQRRKATLINQTNHHNDDLMSPTSLQTMFCPSTLLP